LTGFGEQATVPAPFSKQELDKRLVATYYSSQASLLEQGAVTLYVALGFLKWKLKADSEEVYSAPLLLIPVELQRASISAGFRLRYSGDEVTPNFCLVELAKRLSVQMPQLPESRDIQIPNYFDAIRRSIANVPSWYVDADAVSLGLFSFSKMLMYSDLDPAIWPSGALLGHPTIATILGGSTFSQAPPQPVIRSSKNAVPDKHSQEDMPAHVMDADSSQIEAILEIQRGSDLVIQGPPGTGKSQTIVNVIANAVADNKTVLFVSEKLAALEVVKKRLEAVGLGAIVLEIHSNRTRRNSVFEQLRKTLDLRANPPEKVTSDLVVLKTLRDRLNDYCSAVNDTYGLSEDSPYGIYGSLSALDELFQTMAAPTLELPEAATWTTDDLQKKRQYIEKLQAPLITSGVPVNNPYWGVPAISISPVIREKIRQALLAVESSLDKLRKSAAALSSALGGSEPTTWEEVNVLKETGPSLLKAPPLNGIDVSSDIWSSQSSHIHEAIANGTELSEITKKWKSVVAPEAWTRDITEIKKTVAQLKGKWLKERSPQFTDLKDDMAGLLTGSAPRDADGLFAIVDAIDRAQKLDKKIEDRGPLLAKIFGSHWRGSQSDWALLRQQTEWIELTKSKEPNGRLPSWLLPLTTKTLDQGQLWQLVTAVQNDEAEYVRVRDLANSLLGVGEDKEEISLIRESSRELERLQEAYRTLASRIQELGGLTSYLQAREECLEHLGPEIVQVADRWEGAANHLLDFFEFARLSVLAEGAFGSRPALTSFNAVQHNKCVEDFRRLDAASLQWSQSAIAIAHVDRMLNATAHKASFNYLVTTSEMPNSQPPIRKLAAKAADAIQVVKPVFMMSPSSVASFLPPGTVHFDLIVFDEASQLRPADALGAIARGKQTVVVGDNKQLPPTRLAESRPSPDSDVDGNKLADVESVLGLFCSRGARQQVLKWHYRSKHESLIAQSNNIFYDNQLIVFPSPDKRRIDVGLICNYISLAGLADGGSASASRDFEAAQVAKAVMRHAAGQMAFPPAERLSLGVATLTALQRDRVLEQVEALRQESPESEEFFNADQHELFFVKNLESVQGDERDVILISLGYGVAVAGSSHQALGPILREGGERRVNVLFTRARRRCELFTTLSSADVIISEHSPTGLIAFKNFLQYAETGRINRPGPIERKNVSPFEALVAERIERLGYVVKKNVGLAGFLIDLAVVDPQEPDRYVLGIICDGPSYKSAQSSRDRDRLREETLKNMGWNLYRVWSTAWFQNLQREEASLFAVLQKAAPSRERQPVELRPKLQATVNLYN
jgi:very-short-patch-repair endonuclease/DNA polymerase III delta prime subunit